MPNIQCVNDDELRLEGEDNTDIESYVKISIEHCTEYESSENCASDEEVKNYWGGDVTPNFVIIFNGKEIDL